MKPSFSSQIQRAVAAILKAKKVLIVSHVHPDGDTIGCQLALGLALIEAGKKVTMLSQDGVPTRLQFLPGSELIVSEASERTDVAIAVDCGSVRQLGRSQAAFFKAKATIQIDHHDFGRSFGGLQVLEMDAAAVGEIVYEVIRALKVPISSSIATCLLTSIIIDTGSFRFSNIRPRTFEICGELMKKGVDLRYLIEESYWRKTRPMARLSSRCVLHAKFSKDGALAWAVASQKDIQRFGAKLSDADSVADDLRSIEGVEVAALFRETEKKNFRVSLRSKHGIHVALVAKQFGGGGHHNSAGCAIRATEAEKKKLLTALEDLLP